MRMMHYYPRALIGDGGVTLAVRQWAQAVADLGHEVTIVGLPASESRIGTVTYKGLHHSHQGLSMPRRVEQILEGVELAFVHSAWVPHNVAFAAKCSQRGVPYVLVPHGGYDANVLRRGKWKKMIWLHLWEKRLLTHASALHVFFDEERESLKTLGYTGPVVVAPHGIHVAEAGAQWDGGSGAYVLWFGRFDVRNKGLDLLLRAISRIPSEGRPQLRLYGPDWRGGRRVVRRIIRDHDLDGWVSIGGILRGAEKWAALKSAALFVYPSRWEAQGLALMEAAAVGVPLITTTASFLGQRLSEDDAALVAPPDPDKLAAAIVTGLQPDANRFGIRARKVMTRDYRWSTVAQSLLRQLEKLGLVH